MTRPRVLVMGDGGSIHVERWCRYLSREKMDVALFSLEPVTIAAPETVFAGRRPTGKGLIDYALSKTALKKALAAFRPDVVNAHFAASYGWLAAACEACPVIVTAWGGDLLVLPEKLSLYRRRVARALETARYCTVDSRNLANAVAQYMPADKIVCVVMGIERDAFEQIAKTDFTASSMLRVIAPRGLQDVYNPRVILDAAALVKDKLDMHITMRGDGVAAERMRAVIDKRGLADVITLSPTLPYDEYAASLKHFDVYLSASLSDSTSVALLEGMAAGLFPVVSDIDGNREWVRMNENGLLFSPRSSEDLAEKLLQAAHMRDGYAAIACKNRERIVTDAIWEDNMARIINLIESLTNG